MAAGQKEKGSGARRAAVSALIRVHRGQWPNLAAGALAAPSLAVRDRAFAGAVFFGGVERLATLDFLLAPLLAKPLERLDVEVRAILETGLYQLLYMRVPQSAAVNESVKLARDFGKSSAASLVNAVLRKATRMPWAQRREGAAPGPDFTALSFADEKQRLCVQYSVGPVVAEAVMSALPADYEAFLAASFSKGELCLRANTLKASRAELAEALQRAGAETRQGQLPYALYASLPGAVADDPLFAAGLYHVQGEASQFACACVEAQKGDVVLDLCAAPGGKSATLAEEMGGGAGLFSCDIDASGKRLPLISESFGRLGIAGAQVIRQDASVYSDTLPMAERVLCDVPCSSLGVMAQKPDLRYTEGENFGALPALQLKILRTALRYVKKGGRLVYSTCTIRREENREVVAEFLRDATDFRLLPPPMAPEGAAIEDNMMTILPQRSGLDGFFVATMERL